MVSIRTLSLASLYQIATVAAVGLFAMWRWPEGVSGVLLGGMVMVLNFAAARALAARVLGPAKPRALYVVALAVKFALLLMLVAGILYFMRPDVAAFALGLCTFFAGVILALLHQSVYTRTAVSHPG